jgi:hypothetical protein
MKINSNINFIWAVPGLAEKVCSHDYRKQPFMVDCSTWMTMWTSIRRQFDAGSNWVSFGMITVFKD